VRRTQHPDAEETVGKSPSGLHHAGDPVTLRHFSSAACHESSPVPFLALPPNPVFIPIKQVDLHFHADSSSSLYQKPTHGTSGDPNRVPVVIEPLANSLGAKAENYIWKDGPQKTTITP